MNKSLLLLVDAIINLGLGLLLVPFPQSVVSLLGVPVVSPPFYASVLGAVFIGIGLALLMEYFRKPGGLIGLGLGGAVAINLCGGFCLAGWLVFGDLGLPMRGLIFLWSLFAVLVGLSSLELLMHVKASRLRGLKTREG